MHKDKCANIPINAVNADPSHILKKPDKADYLKCTVSGPGLLQPIPVRRYGAAIRSCSTFCCDATIGYGLRTGHNTMVRDMTKGEDTVPIGANTAIDGHTSPGNDIQSNVYISTDTVVEELQQDLIT